MSTVPNLAGYGESLEDKADALALGLYAKGQPQSAVITELMAMGLGHQSARRIAADARETAVSLMRRRAFRGVILGAAILVAGSLMAYTLNVFDIRSPYDFIGYGIIAYGFFTLLINAWTYQYPPI